MIVDAPFRFHIRKGVFFVRPFSEEIIFNDYLLLHPCRAWSYRLIGEGLCPSLGYLALSGLSQKNSDRNYGISGRNITTRRYHYSS
jgi:hypothetical protein